MKIVHLLTLLLIFNTLSAQKYIDVQGKKYFLGCKISNQDYTKVAESQQFKTRGVESLGTAFSLESYLPKVGDQEMTGTCTAWATAFYTLSILYNKNITDPKKKLDFSPYFLYNNIKYSYDSSCQEGSNLYRALNFLKFKGGLPNKFYQEQCKINRDDQTELWDMALSYRIKDFKRIGEDNKIQRIKRALTLKKAIVIAIKTPYSFASSLNGDTWDGIFDYDRGGHALSLIGYDDNKEGGSFLIINSWGKEWGDNGKIWVKYSDLDKLVMQVFEVTGYNDSEIKRYSTRNNFEGEIRIFDKKGKEIEQKINEIEPISILGDTSEIVDDDSTNRYDTSNIYLRKKIVTDTILKPDTLVVPEEDEIELNKPVPALEIIPEIIEYNFEYDISNSDCENGFKIKITNKDSGYIYLFSSDEFENTVTPISRNNNTQIFLGKKKPDIILPETEYIKECGNKKFILLISKEIINESNIERICTRKYSSAYDFINYNFSEDLVITTPKKDDLSNKFSLKNEPGKILPIIINLNEK